MLKLHAQLKEDNSDALLQIDKLVKRVRQLQGEQERATDDQRQQSERLQAALGQSQTLSEENSELKARVTSLEKELSKLRAEQAETIERLTDTKSALREAELNCNKLYKDIGQQNSQHADKIFETQQKFEEASLMIAKQSALVDDLNV